MVEENAFGKNQLLVDSFINSRDTFYYSDLVRHLKRNGEEFNLSCETILKSYVGILNEEGFLDIMIQSKVNEYKFVNKDYKN